MKIECKTCGAVVPSDNLNLDRMIAKCGACDAVFAFAVEGQAQPSRAPEARPRGGVPKPKTLEIGTDGGQMTVTRRWRNGCAVVFLIVFTIFWNAISWTGLVLAWNEFWPMALFVGLFVLIGAAIAYLTVAVIVNATVISVGRDLLTVRHGPLPMPGNRDVRTQDLDQLYVVRHVSSSSSHNGRRSTSVSYQLRARMKDGSGATLLRSMQDAEEALYLEELIERVLGIEDAPVRGEL